MAKRISQLPEETSVATGDQIPIYDASTGTTKRATVTNVLAGVKDGTLIEDDAILARHIDWAGTGADGGIWWEELGRTTLGSAGDTISLTPIASRKYLKILASCLPSSQIRPVIRFNNDSGSNYSYRFSLNGAADGTAVSQTAFSDSTASTTEHYLSWEVVNIAAYEKIGYGVWWSRGTAGAGNAPVRLEGVSKWANTTNAITRVDVVNTGTGDFAIGSELVVLGHD
jgi:hypothetical protein